MKNLLMNKRIKSALIISKLANYKIVHAFLCSWLIALGAHITIPFYPIPMTLQTFVIVLISLLMPFRVVIGSLVFYISYAAMGIPVLAGGNKGITGLTGPTAGFIIGFFLMSAAINVLIKSYPTSDTFKRFLFTLIGSIFLFSIGLAHLSHLFGWNIAIKAGLLPFVFSEPIKFILASYLSVLIQGKYLKSK